MNRARKTALPTMEEGKKPIVLVVDDDVLNLRTYRRVFRKDYDLTLASSGSEALEELSQRAFDVVLVDFSMPEMNGRELIIKARALQPSLPAVFVTGYPDHPEVQESLDQGLAREVVPKPWERQEILESVRRCLDMTEA